MRQVRLDTRIGGFPRYVVCDERELMQVPFELLTCVCFVEVKSGSRWDLAGTAFLLSRPLEGVNPAVNPEPYAVYAVTAKHVLKMPGSDGRVVADDEDDWWYDDARLRLNRVGGGTATYPVPPDQWAKHPESDTAVISVGLPYEVFDCTHYPSQSIVDGPFFADWQVTPGEEVVLPGLLSVHPGITSMQPIVRVGNVAALPLDPVSMETGDEHAYLIEVRSFGGLSGSPAFLHIADTRRGDWGKGAARLVEGEAGPAGQNFLLGIVNGWFPNHEPESQARHALNTGITAVTLAKRIEDILDSNGFAQAREDMVKEANEKAPRVKSASTGAQSNEEYERFDALARQLVNTPKPAKEEGREE